MPRIASPARQTSAEKNAGLPAAPSHDVGDDRDPRDRAAHRRSVTTRQLRILERLQRDVEAGAAQHSRAVLARLVLRRTPGGARRSRQRGEMRRTLARHVMRSDLLGGVVVWHGGTGSVTDSNARHVPTERATKEEGCRRLPAPPTHAPTADYCW